VQSRLNSGNVSYHSVQNLCLPIPSLLIGKGKVVTVFEYDIMKTYWQSGGKAARILTVALDGGEW
jgi:hypothetical protein